MDSQVAAIVSVLALAMPTAWGQGMKEAVSLDEPQAGFVHVSARQLVGDEKTEWIESMCGKLSIAKREIGPFGMPQDPNSEVVKPQKKQMKKGAFLEAIGAISVNTVMPADNKFTIGSREFIEGDKFPLIKNKRQFNVEIIAVKSSGILFKDVDTGKLVKRNLYSLPAGMKRSTSLVSIQGVFPAGKKNAMPLNLDDEPLPVSNE